MRPAPVRVLTSKVAVPPARVRQDPVVLRARPAEPRPAPAVEPSSPDAPAWQAAAGSAGSPTVAVALSGSGPATDTRARPDASASGRRAEAARGPRWFVALVVVAAAALGGLIGYLVTRGDADHRATSTVTSVGQPLVPAATVAPVTTQAPTSPSTTTPVGQNVLGVVVGTPADPASTHPEERFAAHLGHDEGEASAPSPAALYAVWWELIQGAPANVVASPDGFAFVDGARQTIDLSSFSLGADGKVADLVECASVGTVRPTCNRVSNAVGLDPTAPVVGQSASVTFTRLGEVRLVATLTTRLVSMVATKPITAATSPAGDVRFNDHVLAFVVPSAAVPPSVDVTLTYADGTTEVVTITV